MEKPNSFRFSNDEVRKINFMLPKGYKLVPKEDIIKKDVPKAAKKPKILAPPPPTAPLPPAVVVSKPKSEKAKEEEY